MIERLTSLQIQAHLERTIAHHPGCRGFHVEVEVRRLEQDRGPHDLWEADFYATGGIEDRIACELALKEILARARESYALNLDS